MWQYSFMAAVAGFAVVLASCGGDKKPEASATPEPTTLLGETSGSASPTNSGTPGAGTTLTIPNVAGGSASTTPGTPSTPAQTATSGTTAPGSSATSVPATTSEATTVPGATATNPPAAVPTATTGTGSASAGAALAVSSASGSSGQVVEVAVTVNVTSGVKLGGWLLDVEFDSSRATVDSCTTIDDGLCNPKLSSGAIRFVAVGDGLSGEVGKVKFRLEGASGSTVPLTLANVQCIDTDGKEVTCSVAGGELRIN